MRLGPSLGMSGLAGQRSRGRQGPSLMHLGGTQSFEIRKGKGNLLKAV